MCASSSRLLCFCLLRCLTPLRSGLIDVKEWHRNLRKLGIDVEMTEGKVLFDKLDSDQSGSVCGLRLASLWRLCACPAFSETNHLHPPCAHPPQLELKELQKALKDLQDAASRAERDEKAQTKVVFDCRREARAAQQHAHEQARALSGL